MKQIVLGGGCFWCVEAAFQQLSGVQSVTSGYAGGSKKNPSYREVCSGKTEHAEVVKVVYDADFVELDELLRVFFKIHNPTTMDREGPDVGPQYRSIILYKDEEDERVINEVISEVKNHYEDPIVTEVWSLKKFYEAEDYHQNYYEKNPNESYCRMQIPPKLDKVHDSFPDLAN